MKNVVLFGSIPVATKVLKLLRKNKDLKVIGVCCKSIENSWRNKIKTDDSTVYEYCKKENISIYSHDELIELETKLDIGFSIRYHKILSEQLINRFDYGIINTHGGILPFYRGTYANIHSILNEEKEYGVTLHFIDPGVDTGEIIDIMKTKINKEQTGFDLYLKSEEMTYKIINKNLNKIINKNIDSTKQSVLLNNSNKEPVNYKSSEISGLKYINIDEIKTKESLKKIKAFDSPYHEPAYTIIKGKKIYLRYKFGEYNYYEQN